MLVPALGVAVAIAIAIADVALVIAASRLTFDVDVVVARGSIGRAGWRRVKVRVRRMRRMCRRY